MGLLVHIMVATLAAASTQSLPPESTPAPLTVTPGWGPDRYIGPDALLHLTLSRPLEAGVERLAIVVGATDYGGFAVDEGRQVTIRTRGVRLPPGEHEMVVYVVRSDAWAELARAPLKVLTRGGFESVRVAPSMTLNNTGQVAEHTSALESPSPRPTFQDFSGSAALQGTARRRAVTLQTQWNLAGVSEREQALRFGQQQDAAPLIDLTDYTVSLQSRMATVSLGTMAIGQQRHLLQQFPTRGVSAALTRGPAMLTLAAANGSSVVGWDNLAGLADGQHRVRTAMLGVELVPSRPGTLRLESTLLDGIVRPIAGVARGAVIDAERSDGHGITMSAQSANQRVRLRAEWAQSRYRPARDDQLTGDTVVVPLKDADRRSARWAELSVDLLRQKRLSSKLAADLSATLRHERVDPLYRSVAMSIQADRQESSAEATLALGAVSVRGVHTWNGDNLGDVASILRTTNRQTGLTGTLSLAQLIPTTVVPAPWLPAVSIGWNRTHAMADGVPTNNDFRPQDIPDQLSLAADAAAQWSFSRWRTGYRFNRSFQDNRQSGRERADFATAVHALTLGVTASASLELALDATQEQQENREQDQEQRLRRVGATATWQMTRLAQLTGGYTATVSRDRPSTVRGAQGDSRIEVSHGFDVRGGAGGGARGRIFARYQRLSAETRQMIEGATPALTPGMRLRWSVATGLSYRVL